MHTLEQFRKCHSRSKFPAGVVWGDKDMIQRVLSADTTSSSADSAATDMMTLL